jgi:hypothetical protein
VRWPVGSSCLGCRTWTGSTLIGKDAQTGDLLPGVPGDLYHAADAREAAALDSGPPLARIYRLGQETSSTFCQTAPEPPMRRLASWTTVPGVRFEVEQFICWSSLLSSPWSSPWASF